MVWLAVRLPRAPLRLLLHPICFYFLCTAPAVRRQSRAFMRRVLPRPTLRDTYRQILAFATTLLDRARVLGGRRDGLDVRLEGEQAVFEVLQRGGCVLLTAHVGAFDVMRASARSDEVDVRIVMDRAQGARVSTLLERLDPALARRIIHAGQSGPALVLAVKQAVDAGAIVGIMADRPLPGARHGTCEVLGTPVRLPLAPYLIADVLKVPVLLGFGLLEGDNRYLVHFEVLDDAGLPAGREARALERARRYALRLTETARRHPYNWFNFHDYFADARAGDPRRHADDDAGPRAGGAA